MAALKQNIDFELFRPQLAPVLNMEKTSGAGRKAYDAVLMLKIFILQRLYNLFDQQVEFQITDRNFFRRF